MRGKNSLNRHFLIALIMLQAAIILAVLPVQAAKTPTISSQKLTLKAKESKVLTVKNYKGQIKWSSSKKKVATVSTAGLVKAKSEGKTVITAVAGKTELTCQVTVKAALNKTSVTIAAGKTAKLKVVGTTSAVRWSSSNKKVAKVSKTTGLVTAKKVGTAKITAKFGKKKLICKVTVIKLPAKVTLAFTTKGIQSHKDGSGTRLGLTTKKNSLTIKGTSNTVQLKKFKYSLTNSEKKKIASGSIKPAKKWSVKVNPEVGTNVLKIAATSTNGKKASLTLYITRQSTEIKLTDKVVPATEKEAKKLGKSIISFATSQGTSNGTMMNFSRIRVGTDSPLYKKIKDGSLKKGSVYTVPACDEIPGGFTGVLQSWETLDSAAGGTYMEVVFRQAGWSDIFQGKGSITVNAVDKKNPVDFVMLADGTDPRKATASKLNHANATGKYERKAFPEGLSGKVSFNNKIEKDGSYTFTLKIGGLKLYDFDGLKETNDTVVLDGSLSLDHFKFENHIEWDKTLKQVYFKETYTEKAEAKLTVNTQKQKRDLKEIIKEANNSFSNSQDLGFLEYAGVDMGNRLFLGVLGIKLSSGGAPKLIPDLEKYSEVEGQEPTLLIAVYVDVKGKVTVNGSLSVEYSVFHENGLNILKKNYATQYPSFDEVMGQTGNYIMTRVNSKRKSVNEYGDPEPQIKLQMEAKAELGVEPGVMAGVMVMGIIPAEVYGGGFVNLDGSIKGGFTIKPTSREEEFIKGDAEADATFKAGLQVGVRLGASIKKETGFFKGSMELKADWEKEWKFIEKEFHVPRFEMRGYVRKYIDDHTNNGDIISGAKVRLYEMEKNSIEDEQVGNLTPANLDSLTPDFTTTSSSTGHYEIKKILRKKYIVYVKHSSYEPLIEKMEFKKDVPRDFYLKDDENNGTIEGVVLSAQNQQKLSGVTVLLYQGDTYVASATSGEEGKYSFHVKAGSYQIRITQNGYKPFKYNLTVQAKQTVYTENVLLVNDTNENGTLQGTVKNSVSGAAVSDVTFVFREGWNAASSAAVVKTVSSDGSGKYSVELPTGYYTVTLSKSGFVTGTANLTVVAGNQNKDLTLSPVEAAGTWRIVLEWGATPRDLDSHTKIYDGSTLQKEVYYHAKTYYNSSLGANEVALDLDDTTSYGPETTTITEVSGHTYNYFVHQYTSDGQLAGCGAKVTVYKGGSLVRTYNVPTSGISGRFWYIFRIENGQIQDYDASSGGEQIEAVYPDK